MLQGVIFDMDGVLIDSHPVHRRAWREFLATIGKQQTDQELDFILEGRRRDEILRHFLGDVSEQELAQYGEMKENFFQQNVEEVCLMPGVEKLLVDLASERMRCAVATSASSRRTHETLRRLGVAGYFEAVVTGDDVTAGKPDPEIYSATRKLMNLPAERLLVLEDAPCGVQAAKAAGLSCIAVASNGRGVALQQAGATHVISDFTSISAQDLTRFWQQAWMPALVSAKA